MLYNANGLFTSIGTTFNTPNGATVTRCETPYLPVAAVQKTTDNFLSVPNLERFGFLCAAKRHRVCKAIVVEKPLS